MTTSISVERRRLRASHSLFAIATFLCSVSVTSIAQAQTTEPPPPRTFMMTQTGVNLLDTSFVQEATDLSIGSLSLERSYISGDVKSKHYYSNNWTHNYDVWLESGLEGGDAYVTVVVGRSTYRFNGYSYSNYPQMDEKGTSVQVINGFAVFIDRDGTVYTFSDPYNGRATSIIRPDGTTLSLSYVSDNLKTITSNRGYGLVFDYSGDRVTVACGYNLSSTQVSTSSSCTNASLKTTYAYVSAPNTRYGYSLSTVTDPLSNVTHYGYDNGNSNSLNCVTPPGATGCKIAVSYGHSSHSGLLEVKSQTLADGSTWQFDCSCGDTASGSPDDPFQPEWTTVIRPGGATTSTLFLNGGLYQHTDENNHVYTFDYVGRTPLKMTMPEGNAVTYAYNDNLIESGRTFKAKPNSNQSDIVTDTKTFPSSTQCTAVTCNQPLTITNASGNTTSFTYDQTHGGVLSVMQPAPTPGAARSLTLYTYVQKYAYVLNTYDVLAQAQTSVWLPASETQCQTSVGSSVTTCDASAPQMVTTYEYGANGTPDNLLLRGKIVSSDEQSQRTCYRYDAIGNMIAETSPRAGLTTCL